MEWWEVLVQQTINGLTNGMVFALIALGYTMVYGILELINFAHGDLFMLASFLALTWSGCWVSRRAGSCAARHRAAPRDRVARVRRGAEL